MSRRKRLGLGPKEHWERSSEMMMRAERLTSSAGRQIREGDCGAAFDNLIDAGVLLGTAEAHVAAALPVAPDAVSSLVELDHELGEVREAFQARCMRPREDDARLRTFRRR